MKKTMFIMLAAAFTLTAMSCKKKGCTDSTATNYNSEAKKDDGTCVYPDPVTTNPTTTSSLLCDGIAGSNEYFPAGIGYMWRYESTSGFPVLYKDSVVGTVDEDGFTWFDIERDDESPGGSTSDNRLRVEAGTNNVLYKASPIATPEIVMYGTPAVGQTIFTDFVITSMDATYNTGLCSYTGCIEATNTSILGVSKIYFKKGIGKIGFTSSFGIERLKNFHN